jgi:hypothetical protein
MFFHTCHKPNKSIIRHVLIIFVLLALGCQEGFAQRTNRARKEQVERSPQQTLVYEDKNYLPVIRTVQFHPNEEETGLPVYFLGEQGGLTLSFDDLRGDVRNYYYSIEHCSANWQSSGLSALEYSAGYNEDRITDFTSSVNTQQAYTHYRMTLPSGQVKPTRSGNYLLKIYEDADKKRLIITRKFYVVQPLFDLQIQRVPSPNQGLRESNQKLNLVVGTAGYQITNPYEQIQVVAMQNGRSDVQEYLKRPSFVGNAEIRYENPSSLDFQGGNEFRKVDIRSFNLLSEQVERTYQDSLRNFELIADEDLSGRAYGNLYDENGAFFIRNDDRLNALEEADYAWVHFQLKNKTMAADQAAQLDVYVVGAFNQFQRSDENKLTFHPTTNEWSAKILLKQGLYDYEYTAVNRESKQVFPSRFAGNYYQTENTYQVFVYFRKPGTTWDEIWAFKEAR